MSEKNVDKNQGNYPYVVSVRFKNASKPYSFGTHDSTLQQNDYVVVETVRGQELGEVVSELYKKDEINLHSPLKPVIRKASREDRKRYEDNLNLAKVALEKCQNEVENLKLDMNLISAEYTLDRSKVLIVYVADERVDFRELLKRLAASLHCRIELKQIGSRDKAQLIGGMGVCGMETCCSRFKKNFDVISINMAKNQMLALNIPKLSGQCGKLMCCLKYEDENYKELKKGMPKINAAVTYKKESYRVSSINVITQEVRIDNYENSHTFSFDEFKQNVQLKKVEEQKKKEKNHAKAEKLSK